MALALRKIVSISLLIFVMVILLYAFFISPNNLYAEAIEKTKPLAENVYKLMYKGKEETIKGEIPEDIEELYYNLVDDLNKEIGTAPCLLTHTPFIKDFEDYKIWFHNSKEGTYAYLYKGNRFLNQQEINKKVCVINTKNFYDNYLDGTPCTSDCKTNYREFDKIEITDNGNIWFNGKEYGLKDFNLMFKADNNHICFFPTKRGNGRCDADEYVLDDDCLKDIAMGGYKSIKNCEEDTTIMFYNNVYYGLKKDWKSTSVGGGEAYVYTGTDERVAYKFRTEGISKYEFELLIKGPYEEVPEGKKGVYYAAYFDEKGVYYGVKEDWEYVDTGFFGSKGWRYTGHEKEVPEEFKTQGISIQEKYNIFGPPKTKY